MKKTKDYEYLETSPEAKAAGLRRITRPAFLDKLKDKPLRDSKSRITMYLDSDILEVFKREAQKSGGGYQTLINQALRIAIGNPVFQSTVTPENIKQDLLADGDFLQSLKKALET